MATATRVESLLTFDLVAKLCRDLGFRCGKALLIAAVIRGFAEIGLPSAAFAKAATHT